MPARAWWRSLRLRVGTRVCARHGAEEAGTCAASRCPALCARPPSTGRAGRARGVAGASATTKHAQETQKNWLTSIFVSIVLKHTDIRARAKGPLGLGAIPPLKLEVPYPSFTSNRAKERHTRTSDT